MSSIDELKQNNEKEPVKVEIGNNPQRKAKTVIFPDGTSSNNREVVSPSEMVSKDVDEETPGVVIKESYVKDILEGENSLLGKYIKEKEEEATEWMERKEAEKELEDESVSEEEEKEEGAVIGTDSIRDDIGSLTSDDNTETINVYDVIDYSNDLPPVDESEENDDTDSSDEGEVVVEKVDTVAEKKEEKIDPPDIDLEVSSIETDNTEISLIEDDEDSSDSDTDQDEILKHLQKMATERLKPASHNINLSSFTVAKKPITKYKSLENTNVKAAKWVLPTQESIVLMKEFLGSELETLREYSENNDTSSFFRKYRCLYDHIVSKKPDTFEGWLKSTPYSDIDHYFFAAYISSFKGTNYLPMDCSKERNNGCGESFLTDDIPILDMVKFDDDKAKKTFTDLYQREDQFTSKPIYVSEIIPFSKDIAIGFKDASVYSLLEISSLDARTREKYSNIIDFIPYIDAIYNIDEASHQLIPYGYKIYPDNVNKTIRSKINAFSKILSTLSIDEFSPIRAYINAIRTRVPGISYVLPSVTCPKCGKETPETRTTAEELVFIRYQLGALVNTSLK